MGGRSEGFEKGGLGGYGEWGRGIGGVGWGEKAGNA